MLRSAILTFGIVTLVGAEPVAVTSLRVWSQPDVSRVIVETGGDFAFKHDRLTNPNRVYVDLIDATLRIAEAQGKRYHTVTVNDRFLTRVRAAESQPGTTRIVFDLSADCSYTVSELANPARLVVEFRQASASKAPAVAIPQISLDQMRDGASRAAATGKIASPPAAMAKAVPIPASTVAVGARTTAIEAGSNSVGISPEVAPTATAATIQEPSPPATPALPARRGSKSLTRALGLKLGRIVLDPGHGGHDVGTTSPSGMLEKDLVLDVAKRLGQLLKDKLGAEVAYTRSDDTYVALEKRTEFANERHADLFISIHANSSRYPNVAGPETFFLNFTASPDAMETASRENASSGKTIFELQGLLQKIAMNDKLTESREFAVRVQSAMLSLSRKEGERVRDRGVKRAPFVVLIGAAMPSILSEIGFVTNAREEAQLRKPEYRQRIAESLYRGISKYASGLSRFQVAQRSSP